MDGLRLQAFDAAEAYAYPKPGNRIGWGINAAQTGVNVLRGIRRSFDAYLKTHPEVARKIFEMTLRELESCRDWSFLLGRQCSYERVAGFLLMIATVRLLMADTPSTNVMTTNTTQLAIDATEVLLARLGIGRSGGFPTSGDIGRAHKRFVETAPIVLAFLTGTIAGAMAWYEVDFVCLVLPVAMLAGLTALVSRRAMVP